MKFPNIDVSKFLCPDSTDNQYIWAENLTKMREEMEKITSCRIIAGGKTSGFKGKMAGVLEEFIIARRKGHPVYIVGGYGGCAQLLAEVCTGKKSADEFFRIALESSSYSALLDRYKSIGNPVDYNEVKEYAQIEKLQDNGLTLDENRTLFNSVNIMEIVSLILKGLKMLYNA